MAKGKDRRKGHTNRPPRRRPRAEMDSAGPNDSPDSKGSTESGVISVDDGIGVGNNNNVDQSIQHMHVMPVFGRSSEGILRRQGITKTGFAIRSCICRQPDDCRALMWKWDSIGACEMLEYIQLPSISTKDSPTAMHSRAFHLGCIRHLVQRGAGIIPLPKVRFVAIHHFHPIIRASVTLVKGAPRFQKWRITPQLGREVGLSEADKCPLEVSDGVRTWFAFPSYSFESAMHEYNNKKALHEVRNSQNIGIPLSSNDIPSINPTTPRKTPEVRSHERISREMQCDPNQYATMIAQLSEQLVAAKLDAKNAKAEVEKVKGEHEKEVEHLRMEFSHVMTTTGLTRRSILSAKWHEKWPNMARYLFGFATWESFKVFAKHGFINDNIDTNVTGEGRMTDFEKVCIVAMVVRRRYSRPTIAGIYDRSLASISSYMKDWFPKFRVLGSCLTDLSLEKNHNYVSEAFCKQHGLLFIKEDGETVDYSKSVAQ